jgi:hypothetical protein
MEGESKVEEKDATATTSTGTCTTEAFIDEEERRDLRGDIGKWYSLGGFHELLQLNCAALRVQIYREELINKDSSLHKIIDKCVNHAKLLKGINQCGSDCTFTLSREVEKWCSLAALFLTARGSYQMLKSCPESWEEQDKILKSCLEIIPKASLSYPTFLIKRNWFDNCADVLLGSQDALCQECFVRGIKYAKLQEDFDNEVLLGLISEGNVECAKEQWRNMVVSHLRKLVQFAYEASWQ